VDPRAGLDDVEKRKFFILPGLELNSSVIQPIDSSHTDYPILAPEEPSCTNKKDISTQR
jgi:hypothetical protein